MRKGQTRLTKQRNRLILRVMFSLLVVSLGVVAFYRSTTDDITGAAGAEVGTLDVGDINSDGRFNVNDVDCYSLVVSNPSATCKKAPLSTTDLNCDSLLNSNDRDVANRIFINDGVIPIDYDADSNGALDCKIQPPVSTYFDITGDGYVSSADAECYATIFNLLPTNRLLDSCLKVPPRRLSFVCSENPTLVDLQNYNNLVSKRTLPAGVTAPPNCVKQDLDNDGLNYLNDNCPSLANPDQKDTDGDFRGDVCDPNDDNDIYPDLQDKCPLLAGASQDDRDADGVGDACDNCVLFSNADQLDSDRNGFGDQCDDSDMDQVMYYHDNCPSIANQNQVDRDLDGLGDVCDKETIVVNEGLASPSVDIVDNDRDGIEDRNDNCVGLANPAQDDGDGDGTGDLCDKQLSNLADEDHDGILNADDNCDYVPNPGRPDSDGDGIGDACDPETVVNVGFGGGGGSSGSGGVDTSICDVEEAAGITVGNLESSCYKVLKREGLAVDPVSALSRLQCFGVYNGIPVVKANRADGKLQAQIVTLSSGQSNLYSALAGLCTDDSKPFCEDDDPSQCPVEGDWTWIAGVPFPANYQTVKRCLTEKFTADGGDHSSLTLKDDSCLVAEVESPSACDGGYALGSMRCFNGGRQACSPGFVWDEYPCEGGETCQGEGDCVVQNEYDVTGDGCVNVDDLVQVESIIREEGIVNAALHLKRIQAVWHEGCNDGN